MSQSDDRRVEAEPGNAGTRLPVLSLVLACAMWGVSFPLVKALQLEQIERVPDASSWFLTSWILVSRFALAALVLLPIVARMGWLTRLEMQQGMGLAFFGGIGISLQVDGLAYTEASTSAFLTQAYCVILPLWAAIKTRCLPTGKVVGATFLVLVGGGILSGIRPGHIGVGRGEAETLLAALFFACQILWLENKRFEPNRGRPVTFVMCAGITVLFLPLLFMTEPSEGAIVRAGASWSVLMMVAVLSLMCTVGSFLLMNTFQKRIPAIEAGLIYTTEPVFTAGYALVLPGIISRLSGVNYANETLTLPLLTGGGLILAANVWMQLKRAPHRPSVAPAP